MIDARAKTRRRQIQSVEISRRKNNTLDRLARGIVLNRLNHLKYGRLAFIFNDEKLEFGQETPDFPLSATINVKDSRIFSDMLFGGELGAAEAFMAGHWTTPDLTAVIRIMVKNISVLESLQGRLSRILEPVKRYVHWLNRNTRKGSRKNIGAHYDLGNEFFQLFLDPTMTYSAGIFTSDQSTLEAASIEKMDTLCRKLNLKPEDHLLEIGTGWGAMAVHAAKHYGCQVTTTTISEKQYTWASNLIRQEGLEPQITLLKKDYRDLTGEFDKIVSIEMIEAVGDTFYDTYFNTISRHLKPDGLAAIQAIIISDQHYDKARKNVDFIKRFIFPGSCIPSINAIINSVTNATDMRLFHMEDITPHYARTLAMWREAFFQNIEAVRKQGYSESFIRMWHYYLCYCEGGFMERHIGDVQMVFRKRGCV